jgi:hypothetical protein
MFSSAHDNKNVRLVLIQTNSNAQSSIVSNTKLGWLKCNRKTIVFAGAIRSCSILIYFTSDIFLFLPPLPGRESENIVCQLTGSSDTGDRLTGGMQNISLIPVTYSTPTWMYVQNRLNYTTNPNQKLIPTEGI